MREREDLGFFSGGFFLRGVLVCGLCIGSACDGSKKEGGEQALQEPTIAVETEHPVELAHPEPRVMNVEVRSAATIEALRQVKLSAEASGQLKDLRVQEGDGVRAGQILAQIKQEAQNASVRRARTNLAQARRELARISQLAKKGVVGRQELDQAKDRVKIARLDIRDRGRDLANTKVASPIKGVVTKRSVQPGDFVGAGTMLLEITDFSTLVARVHVAERELDRLAVGQPVQVAGKAALGRQAAGKVLRIAPTVDASTGTVKVTVGLPPQSLARNTDFRPGMYAEVIIKIKERQGVLSLPKSAVIYEDAKSFVILAKDGLAKRQPVQLGQRNRDWVEITGGLTAEDQVVVAGQQNLKDGAKLKVMLAKSDGFDQAAPVPAENKL